MPHSILRLPAVKLRTGLSRSTIYLRIAQDNFPPPVPLGRGRAVGWIEAEVDAWLASQIAQSRGVMGEAAGSHHVIVGRACLQFGEAE